MGLSVVDTLRQCFKLGLKEQAAKLAKDFKVGWCLLVCVRVKQTMMEEIIEEGWGIMAVMAQLGLKDQAAKLAKDSKVGRCLVTWLYNYLQGCR